MHGFVLWLVIWLCISTAACAVAVYFHLFDDPTAPRAQVSEQRIHPVGQRSTQAPRVTARDLPSVTVRVVARVVPTVPATLSPGQPSKVTIAGRSYDVISPEQALHLAAPCPWCQSQLAGSTDVVRCEHPRCRQAAHRRHNEEFGGCGGVCSVL